METTKLYVEYIVVGMETLAIIFLVIFIIIGNAFLPIIKYCIKNIVPSIIMLGWCYILGLIVDRIADIIYDKRKISLITSWFCRVLTCALEASRFVIFTILESCF